MRSDVAVELGGRTLRALRRQVLWWMLGIALLMPTTASAWPSLEGSDALDGFDDMGAILEAFGATDLASPSGYLDGQMYALMLPLLLPGMAITLSTGPPAGDEDARPPGLPHAPPLVPRRVRMSPSPR